MDYVWQHRDWPNWRWNAADLKPYLLKAREARERMLSAAGALHGPALKLAVVDTLTRETVSTSAIEGVAVDAEAVRSSLMKRLQLDYDRGVMHRLDDQARGLIDLLGDATQNHGSLTMARLFEWHRSLFPNGPTLLHPIRVGELRGSDEMRIVSGPVGRQKIHYQAPPRAGLDNEMARFLDWFNGASRDLDPTARATLAHLWFETLHPF